MTLLTRKLMRGARPTPRHVLAAAQPHQVVGTPPAQFIVVPSQLSMWMNGPDPGSPVPNGTGDCVSAEEAFAKAAASMMAGGPEIFITDQTLYNWASTHGVLDGADLSQVLQWMQQAGFVQNGVTYNDGPASSVDWSSPTVLQSAISQGPVKLGVAADQLENAVDAGNDQSGWIGTGFTQEQPSAEDHCISACGYGPMNWLAQQLGNNSVTSTGPGVAVFTWNSIGVLDWQSFLAITFEAWLRSPTTLAQGPTPTPTPTPTPQPTPTPPAPTPTPVPSGILITGNATRVLASRQGTEVIVLGTGLNWKQLSGQGIVNKEEV